MWPTFVTPNSCRKKNRCCYLSIAIKILGDIPMQKTPKISKEEHTFQLAAKHGDHFVAILVMLMITMFSIYGFYPFHWNKPFNEV